MNTLDAKNLYQIQEVTDAKVGKIICHYPMLVTGEPDPIRTPVFAGFTILSMVGQPPSPVQFEILNAFTLEDAIKNFVSSLEAFATEQQSKQVRSSILAGANGSFSKKN